MKMFTKKAFFLVLAVMLMLPMAVSATPRDEDGPGVSGGEAGDTMFNEAPMLAALVASGELDPVDQRLPDVPAIAETVEGIGEYGGQMRVFNNDLVPRGMWGSSLLRVPRDAIGQAPNLAADYEVASDKLSMTIYLRPGSRWSDGEPFTTEDIRFFYDDIHNYETEDGARPRSWTGGGPIDSVDVIDQYTIRLNAPGGVGTYPFSMATWFGSQTNAYQPAHYLKQWHELYNEASLALAEEEGFENWIDAMWEHYRWGGQLTDFDLPKMTPWVPTSMSTSTELHERNAYYWKVDSAGNQLPYVDSVIVQIVDPEVYQLKITSGDADIAWQQTSVDNLQLYMQSEAVGDYTVQLHPGTSGGLVKLDIARTHIDPVLNEIFGDVKFRQAISVAVDREDINNAVYNGLGVERQYAPLEANSYYKEEWGNYYAQYDPALANRLLDEIGLDELDNDGHRMRPDGQTLSIVVEFQTAAYTPVLELVAEYWEAVGLKTTIRLGEVGLIEQRMFASELFAYVHGNIGLPWTDERGAFQNIWTWEAGNNRQWMDWLSGLNTHLSEDLAEGEVLTSDWYFTEVPVSVSAEFNGYEPPNDYKQYRKNINDWSDTEMGSAEYIGLAQEIFDYAVFNLVRLSYVGMVPSPVIVSNRLHNAPTPGWVAGFPFQHQYMSQWMDQVYISE